MSTAVFDGGLTTMTSTSTDNNENEWNLISRLVENVVLLRNGEYEDICVDGLKVGSRTVKKSSSSSSDYEQLIVDSVDLDTIDIDDDDLPQRDSSLAKRARGIVGEEGDDDIYEKHPYDTSGIRTKRICNQIRGDNEEQDDEIVIFHGCPKESLFHNSRLLLKDAPQYESRRWHRQSPSWVSPITYEFWRMFATTNSSSSESEDGESDSETSSYNNKSPSPTFNCCDVDYSEDGSWIQMFNVDPAMKMVSRDVIGDLPIGTVIEQITFDVAKWQSVAKALDIPTGDIFEFTLCIVKDEVIRNVRSTRTFFCSRFGDNDDDTTRAIIPSNNVRAISKVVGDIYSKLKRNAVMNEKINSIVDKLFETDDMPPGKYFVGDPFHVCPNSLWNDTLDATNFFTDETQVVEGFRTFCYPTLDRDDGTFFGTDLKDQQSPIGVNSGDNIEISTTSMDEFVKERSYHVDSESCTLGIVPIDLIRHWKGIVGESPFAEEDFNNSNYGNIVDFDHTFKASSQSGRFSFDSGRIVIGDEPWSYGRVQENE